MNREAERTDAAPKAIGPSDQAIRANGFVYSFRSSGGWALLLEPLNYRRGRRSWLGGIAAGDTSRLFSLLAAGARGGILREFWNYWATAK